MVMQWHTINKDHGASGLEHIRTAHTNNAIGVANKALAYNKAGLMGQCVFNGSDTNSLQLLCRNRAGWTDHRGVFKHLISNYSDLL